MIVERRHDADAPPNPRYFLLPRDARDALVTRSLRAARTERISTARRFVALVALAEALLGFWFFLPAYIANPMAALLGGGTPIDFGRSMRDGHRVFGDGKTWRGLAAGIGSGIVLGAVLQLAGSAVSPALAFGATPAEAALAILLLSVGALVGDLAGAFVKRRLGKPRGARVPGLDQYDFVLGAFALLLVFDTAWWLARYWDGEAIYGLLFIIVITPFLHRAVNILGYRMGAKREPW